MGLYNKTDILISPSGDLSLDSHGDFATAAASGVLNQDITFRTRTNFGELELHPDVGADLEEIIGEPNSDKNVKYGEVKIMRSLTQDGMVQGGDLFVKGVPISNDSSVYYIFVNTQNGQVNMTPDVAFSMTDGFVNIPGAPVQDTGLTFLTTESSIIITQEDGTYIA